METPTTTMKEVIADIVAWVYEQAQAGVEWISFETIMAEFASESVVDQEVIAAIAMIQTAGMVIEK